MPSVSSLNKKLIELGTASKIDALHDLENWRSFRIFKSEHFLESNKLEKRTKLSLKTDAFCAHSEEKNSQRKNLPFE